jgi:hypothetical protein
MKTDSSYRYRILLNDKQLGPFDRRTVVGMRFKKLLGNNTRLIRSDGHPMTVAQLVADRFEIADVHTGPHSGVPVASSLWPSFAVDFGGNWRSTGALGFTGSGTLRYQSDVLRLEGLRRGRVFGSTSVRITLVLKDIFSAHPVPSNESQLALLLKPESPFAQAGKMVPVVLTLDDGEAVNELLSLLNAGS